MKITLLQTDIAWANPEENIAHAEALLEKAQASDLLVMPEMWATGFAVAPKGIAEEEGNSMALRWMTQTTRTRNCAICGSLAIKDLDGSYRNRHYFVTPEGIAHYYDKHHLFRHGHEDREFTAGKEAVIVQWMGWRILLQTCYDLRFPVFSRYGRAGCFDAIIYVANWPEKRQLAWDTLLRARAIENQCYVVGVNRVGKDPACNYAGGSVVVDPIGHTMAECPEGEQSATLDIDIERLREMRRHFRVLDDRDTELLQCRS
ncbi:MAG: nitrilase family protein [Prevotella sp.]|nr:nitrilase family protein [Prevotella sp.]